MTISDSDRQLLKTGKRTRVAQELIERHFLGFLRRCSHPWSAVLRQWDLEVIRMIASVSAGGCYT